MATGIRTPNLPHASWTLYNHQRQCDTVYIHDYLLFCYYIYACIYIGWLRFRRISEEISYNFFACRKCTEWFRIFGTILSTHIRQTILKNKFPLHTMYQTFSTKNCWVVTDDQTIDNIWYRYNSLEGARVMLSCFVMIHMNIQCDHRFHGVVVITSA